MNSPKKVLVQTEDMLRQVIENLVDEQEGLQEIGVERLSRNHTTVVFVADLARKRAWVGVEGSASAPANGAETKRKKSTRTSCKLRLI